MPTMTFNTGLSAQTRPSMGELFRRAQAQLTVAYGGQDALAYLAEEAVLWSSKIEVVDDFYRLVVDIPNVDPQPPIPGLTRKRHRSSLLARNDDADQQAIDKSIAAMRVSADTLSKVARILSAAKDPRIELQALEKTGVHTEPARKFLYQKQATFEAVIDSTSINFPARDVRARVEVGGNIGTGVTISPARTDSFIHKCLIGELGEGAGPGGLSRGGVQNFRFDTIDSWRRIALEGARELQIPLQMRVSETISTCSLRYSAHDVHAVENWREIVEATICLLEALQKKFFFEASIPDADEPQSPASPDREPENS